MYNPSFILKLIDLTSLNTNDDSTKIYELCKKSHTEYGDVAAVCIYPKFILNARQYFVTHKLNINIATVVNFPYGNNDIKQILEETSEAISFGADEIDIVFPYKALINGNETIGADMILATKKLCHNKILKTPVRPNNPFLMLPIA